MLRLLVPIDGSEVSGRAVEHLVRKLAWYKETPEIHLLNVQPHAHHDVGMFVSHEQLQSLHREEGEKALASARARLEAAKIAYIHHIGLGEPAHVIAHYAKEKAADQIVMGTHGRGNVAGMLMGSVATKLLHLTEVPVLLVK